MQTNLTNIMFLTDFYKDDHRRQYVPGTTKVYSNMTPRGSRVEGQKEVMFFSLQGFLQEYFMEYAEASFFSKPLYQVLEEYQQFLDECLGPTQIGTEHIKALHQLGYMPLQFFALPEGTMVPLRVPMFTYENTLDEFFWLTNYFETLISTQIWKPCTSGTTARRYKQLLASFAAKSGNEEFVQWQGHDFSFRGMSGWKDAEGSGSGHLISFTGTDTQPSIIYLKKYYDAKGLIGGSVPATEHSVMCCGSKENELETFRRLLKLYPTGIVSIVSDTWDLWKVITEILPQLKDEIMARDGKLVIRPDSGVPELIICGDPSKPEGSPANKGVVQLLWEIFGGTINAKRYKELDSHIGCIYGDAITYERARAICSRLIDKGFASTNVVLGIGSFTYNLVTRDTYGFAVKSTYAVVNGKEVFLEKDPVTDDGLKKSATGRIAVLHNEQGNLYAVDGLTLAEEQAIEGNNLKLVWKDGNFVRRTNLAEVRTFANFTGLVK